MREGLVVIQVLGTYRRVTRVGWARRVEGDEWELVGARTIWRRYGNSQPVAIGRLAAEGLPDGHQLLEADDVKCPELLHRFSARRVFVANAEKWAKHCPRPKGWTTR